LVITVKFVKNFASIAAPLNDLLKKHSSKKLQWSDDKTESFNKLKLFNVKTNLVFT